MTSFTEFRNPFPESSNEKGEHLRFPIRMDVQECPSSRPNSKVWFLRVAGMRSWRKIAEVQRDMHDTGRVIKRKTELQVLMAFSATLIVRG